MINLAQGTLNQAALGRAMMKDGEGWLLEIDRSDVTEKRGRLAHHPPSIRMSCDWPQVQWMVTIDRTRIAKRRESGIAPQRMQIEIGMAAQIDNRLRPILPQSTKESLAVQIVHGETQNSDSRTKIEEGKLGRNAVVSGGVSFDQL